LRLHRIDRVFQTRRKRFIWSVVAACITGMHAVYVRQRSVCLGVGSGPAHCFLHIFQHGLRIVDTGWRRRRDVFVVLRWRVRVRLTRVVVPVDFESGDSRGTAQYVAHELINKIFFSRQCGINNVRLFVTDQGCATVSLLPALLRLCINYDRERVPSYFHFLHCICSAFTH